MTPESNHRISCVDVRELGFLPSTRTLGNSWAQLDSIIHAGTIALQSLGEGRLLQWAALVVSLTREREQHA